ncbi:MAG: hypothetical protein EAX95_14685 [Candidatus Thorarchaeota archaeon]|nr:hypothetical protein [Candidatus Thorarchaeota archaeon]
MSRKGALLGLLTILLIAMSPTQVAAYQYSATYTWHCGLKVSIHVENIDIWATGIPYDIIARLTLVELGDVGDILGITFALRLVTESVDTGIFATGDTYAQPGDSISVVGRFNITPEQINYAWDTGYVAEYFYQLNQTVRLTNGTVQNLWMSYRGPHHASFSTASFIIYWPWLPIIFVFFIYWGIFYGVRRFNKRYDEVVARQKANLQDKSEQKSSSQTP